MRVTYSTQPEPQASDVASGAWYQPIALIIKMYSHLVLKIFNQILLKFYYIDLFNFKIVLFSFMIRVHVI